MTYFDQDIFYESNKASKNPNKYIQNLETDRSIDFYKLENTNYIKNDLGIDKVFKTVTLAAGFHEGIIEPEW